MDPLNDHIAQAARTAQQLAAELTQAHSAACYESALAQMLLFDLLPQVTRITTRLEAIQAAINPPQR